MLPFMQAGHGEAEGPAVAALGHAVNDRAAGVAKIIVFRDLVEGFAHRVVDGGSQHGDMVKSVRAADDGMPAGDQQSQKGVV